MNNAECEIPFNFIYALDNISKEFLKKLSPYTLYQLSTILSSKQMLSEDMGKNIIEM